MSEKCILDPERDCLGLIKAKEIEEDINELRKQNSATHERIFSRVGDLEKNAGILGVQYENILEKLSELTLNLNGIKNENKEISEKLSPLSSKLDSMERLSVDVEELKSKPGKRWDSVIEKAVGIIVAAVVGFMLAKIGM